MSPSLVVSPSLSFALCYLDKSLFVPYLFSASLFFSLVVSCLFVIVYLAPFPYLIFDYSFFDCVFIMCFVSHSHSSKCIYISCDFDTLTLALAYSIYRLTFLVFLSPVLTHVCMAFVSTLGYLSATSAPLCRELRAELSGCLFPIPYFCLDTSVQICVCCQDARKPYFTSVTIVVDPISWIQISPLPSLRLLFRLQLQGVPQSGRQVRDRRHANDCRLQGLTLQWGISEPDSLAVCPLRVAALILQALRCSTDTSFHMFRNPKP